MQNGRDLLGVAGADLESRMDPVNGRVALLTTVLDPFFADDLLKGAGEFVGHGADSGGRGRGQGQF